MSAVTSIHTRSLLTVTTAALAVGLLTAGCGPKDDDEPPVIDTGVADMGGEADAMADAMADAAPDTMGETGDTGVIDSGDTSDTADGGDTGPAIEPLPPLSCEAEPMAQSVDEPAEIDVLEWVVAGATDRVSEALSDGDFEVPNAGEKKFGTEWEQVFPEEDGKIPTDRAFSNAFAATYVQVDADKVIFAKADNVSRIFVNGRRIPGDVYGHGDKRVAIPLEKGANSLAILFRARSKPKVEFFETSDHLFYNLEDITAPDLRVGHQNDLPVGVPIVNLGDNPMLDVQAKVVGDEHFEATTVDYASLPANATTQVGWDLKPKKAWSTPGETITVTLRLETCTWAPAYEQEIELKTVAADEKFKRTFRSPVDKSVQYYGVVPPENYTMGKKYGMVLSLHGASVEARGQAGSYSKKEWAYIIAPTNRRRFGFDWEEWGRLNGMNALNDAMDHFTTDPTKVHVTGHSMGGHGTWHFGVMHPGRFATVGPSAGWQSFYTYGGAQRPQGAVGRARAHSSTKDYMSNLADRGGYIIHGTADRNVPISEGKNMRDMLKMYTMDVKWHAEEGAKHWWNGDRAEGTDCVDWPPLFTFMKNHTLDPHALDFEFTSPGPWASDEHSYVTVRSSTTPMKDYTLTSEKTGMKTVELTTDNVRSMVLDGQALADKGVETVNVDGQMKSVSSGPIEIGPTDGKTTGMNGTLNKAFHAPFCFVYPRSEPVYRRYATYLSTTWQLRGNGHNCAIPLGRVDQEVRQNRNLIYLGVDFDEIPNSGERAFGWDEKSVSVGPNTYQGAAGVIAFPDGDGDRMAAAMVAADGQEDLLFGFQPFSSRSGMPDYLIFSSQGGQALGFFDNEWKYDSSLGAAR